ncbi:sensor histidine kinase [Paenibacillus piri]|nr:sensor histidine kinase [Paenibacillus piri]
MEGIRRRWNTSLGFISLRTKLITAFTVCILLPVIGLGVYVYKSFEQEMSSQIAKVTSDRLQQVNRNIERRLMELTNASRAIVLDGQLRAMLQHPPQTDKDKLQLSHFMDKKYLEVSTAVISDPIYLTLYDTRGNYYTNWNSFVTTRDDLAKAPWFKKTLDKNGFMVWTLQHDSYVNPSGEKLMTVSMLIKADNLIDNLGVLVISQPVQPYLELLNPEHDETLSPGFIIDQNGTVLGDTTGRFQDVYQAVKPEIERNGDTFNTRIGGKMSVVSSYLIPMTGWRVVQIVPYSEMFKTIINNRNIAVVIMIVCLTLFAGLIVLLTSMMTKPLRELRKAMKMVENGSLDVVFRAETRDEIGFLGKSFNSMLADLRGRIENEIVLEKRKEQAKLEALQAQITPHFLYNTMNTIKWMSIMSGNKQITEMLKALGHLLNTSIHRGQEEISLREELENVSYFLTIQKYRFGDTVQVEYDIDEQSLEALVPKLSLQPLVENVYQHGLFMENGGQMCIRSRRHGACLYLTVEDTGRGLTEERIDEIMRQMKRDRSGPSIGLANVNRRIKLMYGEPCGITIERAEDEGLTRVTIMLPFVEGDRE